MQPLEMILGFNKDEGLHVIIDLLMDPTNDTNFRLVMLLDRSINVLRESKTLTKRPTINV